MNPLIGNQKPQNGGGFLGGPFAIIAQFNNFKKNFTGDPKQRVQELLNSGQMTQDQLEQLSALATQYQGLLR